jgi:nitrate/TMAO reductase-like tetraheme cytochrome c subunit
MAKIVDAVKKRMPTTRRGKIILYSILGFGAFMFIMSVSIAVWSGYPSFCKNCHHMEGFYRTWQESRHGREGVPCLACHAKPGVVSYVKVKMNGLLEVVKTAIGAIPTKLRSTVPNDTCLRSGCHTKEELSKETIAFGEALFDHSAHFDPVRGIELRCASCHAASLHSANETVKKEMCYTCHFKPVSEKERAADASAVDELTTCESCHKIPAKVKLADGSEFDHAAYQKKEDVGCEPCHGPLVTGAGIASKTLCVTCHNEYLHHLDKYDDLAFMHETHVTSHQVACFECHADMQHGGTGNKAMAGGDCSACHVNQHDPVGNLYKGVDPDGAKAMPDPMSLTNVRCDGCHVEPLDALAAADAHPETAKSCVTCHEEGYDELAEHWESAFDGYIATLVGARAKASGDAATLAKIDADIAAVKKGHAVHNVRYAAKRLASARDALAQALPAAERRNVMGVLPEIEKAASSCVEYCHLGVDAVGTLTYAKQSFPHRAHLLSTEVACVKCHKMSTFGKDGHGETIPKTNADCLACHHGDKTASDCASCHRFQEAVFKGKLAEDPTCKPSPMHKKDVTCAKCHKDVASGHDLAKIRSECIRCHKNNEAYGKMLDEWHSVLGKEVARMERLVKDAEAFLADPSKIPASMVPLLGRAAASGRRALSIMKRDGSVGAHNLDYFDVTVAKALKELERALGAVGR